MGGNFWQGAATGFVVSALNHAAHNETQAGGDPPDEGCVICPDYNLDGRSSWWEWTIDGALYAGDFLLGGPTGESLLAKSALMGIFKGAGVKAAGNLKNVKLISNNLLKKQGLDAHAIKTEFLGPKNISKYDLYKHSNTGEILILSKGGKGTPISTGYFIK